LFASIIAPFGGFFASGFKRAFKIKDFSDSIPGHGGITDKMDCQAVLVWSWLSNGSRSKQEKAHVLVLKVLIFKWVLVKIKEKLSKQNWVIKEKKKKKKKEGKGAVIFGYRANNFGKMGGTPT
jgi:hypothetical protein